MNRKVASLLENISKLFIIAFIVLLLVSALVLYIGMGNLSDRISEVAYYDLVLGVLLQLAVLIVKRGEKDDLNQLTD